MADPEEQIGYATIIRHRTTPSLLQRRAKGQAGNEPATADIERAGQLKDKRAAAQAAIEAAQKQLAEVDAMELGPPVQSPDASSTDLKGKAVIRDPTGDNLHAAETKEAKNRTRSKKEEVADSGGPSPFKRPRIRPVPARLRTTNKNVVSQYTAMDAYNYIQQAFYVIADSFETAADAATKAADVISRLAELSETDEEYAAGVAGRRNPGKAVDDDD
ncbi:MAG: hypothetical protein Q9213_005252 [Squamulea squamosa]